VSHSSTCQIIKYADDTALIGRIHDNDESDYRKEIADLVNWCDQNNLSLNVKKTNEMVFDFRKVKNDVSNNDVVINGDVVGRVKNYKYLGTIVDDELKWNENTIALSKKASQRLFFLRKLKEFQVEKTIMSLFYVSVIQSLLMFNLVCHWNSLSFVNKRKLNKIRNSARKIMNVNTTDLNSMYVKNVLHKVDKVMKDSKHPLHNSYTFLPSGNRLRSVARHTSRFNNTFVPASVMLFNNAHTKRK
jgi:hypothetical protein